MATGREIDCNYVATNGVDMAFLRVENITIADAAAVFSNPEETETMQWQELTLTGFTQFYRLAPEGDVILIQMGVANG